MLQSRLVQILKEEAKWACKSRVASGAAAQAWANCASRAFSTTPESPERKPNLPPQYFGKIVAKLSHAPRFALKQEILNLFPGCNLNESDVATVVDHKVRVRHWRVVFNSSEDYQRGVAMISQRRRLGPKLLQLDPEDLSELYAESDPNHPNRAVDFYRGDSLLMLNCPEDATTESIENFFESYFLAPAPFQNIRIPRQGVRTPLKLRVQGDFRQVVDLMERRVLVKFISPMEAFRALREKNKEFLDTNPIDLRILQ